MRSQWNIWRFASWRITVFNTSVNHHVYPQFSWGPGFHMALRHGGFNNSISIVSGHFSGDNMRHVLRLHEISHPESSVLWLAWEFMNGWTRQTIGKLLAGWYNATCIRYESSRLLPSLMVLKSWPSWPPNRPNIPITSLFSSFGGSSITSDLSALCCEMRHTKFATSLALPLEVSKNKWLELKWPWINTIQYLYIQFFRGMNMDEHPCTKRWSATPGMPWWRAPGRCSMRPGEASQCLDHFLNRTCLK